MKTKGTVLTMLLVLSLSCFAQESEKRFGIELNSGASVCTKKTDDVTFNPGFGFEGILHYRFMSHLGVYAGWGWNRFGSEMSFAGNDVCFEETGYVMGLNFKHPLGQSKMDYFLRAGALYNHIETENNAGDIINDTKHGWGYQLAGGIAIPFGNNWSFTPGLKFNSLVRDTEFEGDSQTLFYQYVSVRVGVIKQF
ncbi:outer membrane beta-barrel protein [Saccharicrinis sp. FJH62]|uniref:outer membrane beta-barrel protein n=1 Tax=Saccharicrinis sp. FJH62 TaxID=3344657 RepID=UPI0035D4BAE7